MLASFSKGSFSKIVLSPSIKSNTFVSATKKPPLIQFSPLSTFSLNFVTVSCSSDRYPNLAGGLTAVTVSIFL